MSECLKARSAEQSFELLVSQPGIGDRGFALECFELLLLGARAGGCELVLEQFVDEHVHAADKEAGHRGNATNIFACSKTLFQGT